MVYPANGVNSVHKPAPTAPDGWYAYTCAHCGNQVSGAVLGVYEQTRWLICTSCGEGSVLTNSGLVYPSVRYGPKVEGLPADVAAAYEEARTCMAGNAFTASELVCRKILMHVAVEKGAKEGSNFATYLAHLEKLGYVNTPMKPWVDRIRKHGNQSTHELPTPDRRRAEDTMMFTAELLRLVYEMQSMVEKYAAPTGAEE